PCFEGAPVAIARTAPICRSAIGLLSIWDVSIVTFVRCECRANASLLPQCKWTRSPPPPHQPPPVFSRDRARRECRPRARFLFRCGLLRLESRLAMPIGDCQPASTRLSQPGETGSRSFLKLLCPALRRRRKSAAARHKASTTPSATPKLPPDCGLRRGQPQENHP